jgi:hypothetical protein
MKDIIWVNLLMQINDSDFFAHQLSSAISKEDPNELM